MGVKDALFGWLIKAISGRIRKLESDNKRLSSHNEKLTIEVEELTLDRGSWKSRHDAERKKSRDLKSTWERDELGPIRDEVRELKILVREMSEDRLPPPAEESDSPNSISEALSIADSECENILFFEDAKRSAKKCEYEDPERLINVFRIMDNEAEKWFELEEGTGSYEDALSKTGLDIADSDSDTAHQAYPRVFKTRNDQGKQVKREMLRHVKLGVSQNPKRTMRIHYEAVRANRKILIGYCGKHLPIR